MNPRRVWLDLAEEALNRDSQILFSYNLYWQLLAAEATKIAGLGLGNAVWEAEAKAILSPWMYLQPGLLFECSS